jgi:hypothetical protein
MCTGEKLRNLSSETFFVRNCQFFSAAGATVGQNPASVGCGHSGTEAMFVGSFSVRRLECSFHWDVCFIVFFFFFRVAKVQIVFDNTNPNCFFLKFAG